MYAAYAAWQDCSKIAASKSTEPSNRMKEEQDDNSGDTAAEIIDRIKNYSLMQEHGHPTLNNVSSQPNRQILDEVHNQALIGMI
jgi:hypothetical protein